MAADSVASFDLLPPHDLKATNPHEAYPLESLVPNYLYSFLELDVITRVKDAAGDSTACDALLADYPRFIVNRIYNLNRATNVTEMAKLLIIMSYFFQFRSYKNNNFNDKSLAIALPTLPKQFARFFTDNYTEAVSVNGRTTRTKSQPMKMKLDVAIACLALHVDDFKTSPHILGQDLSLGSDRILDLFKSLGCKIRSSKKRFTSEAPWEDPEPESITLPTPISLPKVKNASKTRRN